MSLNLRDLPFICSIFPPWDDMESYAALIDVDGVDGGKGFDGPYVDRFYYLGIQNLDTCETYGTGVSVTGLNGVPWPIANPGTITGEYVDRLGYLGMYYVDDIESYGTGVAVEGLNGGYQRTDQSFYGLTTWVTGTYTGTFTDRGTYTGKP